MTKQTTYQRKLQTYKTYADKYDSLQVPRCYCEYLYDELGLSQLEARCFTYLLLEKEVHLKEGCIPSAQFRGACGLPVHKGSVKNAIYDFKAALPDYKWFLTTSCFDAATNTGKSAKMRIKLTEAQQVAVDLLYSKTDTLVNLSPEPIKYQRPKKKKRKAAKDDPKNSFNNEHHLEPLMNYLNGRRVKQSINKLSKTNGVSIDSGILYHEVTRSPRIYTNGDLLNDRELRKKFFKGCFYIDINNTHLSIIASLWKLPKLSAQLAKGQSMWCYLAECLNVELDAEGITKQAIKTFIYSLVYGMEKSNLANQKYGKSLLDNPIIQEILAYRDSVVDQLITNNKTLVTAFSDTLSVNPSSKIKPKKQAISILSQYIQSYEQSIMYNAFLSYVCSHKDIVLVGYLHDGVYISCSKHHSSISRYAHKLGEAIVTEGHKLGIALSVSVEEVK